MTFLDQYCERAGDAGLMAEPLNALTNLAFIIATVLAARVIYRSDLFKQGLRRNVDILLLVIALFSIGIGSGLWHIFATPGTLMADVIPIGVFIHVYLIAALRRLFHVSWFKTLGWWGSYFILSLIAQKTLPPDLLHGTVMYLPTYGAMLVMTVVLRHRKSPASPIFARVVGVWTLSLIFRTVDLEICALVPIGTHFLWHVLNAWVLWRLLMVLIPTSNAKMP